MNLLMTSFPVELQHPLAYCDTITNMTYQVMNVDFMLKSTFAQNAGNGPVNQNYFHSHGAHAWSRCRYHAN